MTKEEILRQEWKKAGFEMDETNEAWKVTLQAMQIYTDNQLLIHSVVIASQNDGNIESADYCIGDYDDESDKK